MSKERHQKLKLQGGKSPKMVKGDEQARDAQDEAFFAALAETCNVTRSAEMAGVSSSTCYKRRREDAGYRQRWAEALAEGYAKLELALLERALVGSEKKTTYKDGSEQVVREYPNALALSLLKLHRATVREAGEENFDEQEVEEARARIVARLDKIKERSEAPEGKCA